MSGKVKITWLILCKITGITKNDKSFKWQKECRLQIDAEAFMTNAQDHALSNEYLQTQILRKNDVAK